MGSFRGFGFFPRPVTVDGQMLEGADACVRQAPRLRWKHGRYRRQALVEAQQLKRGAAQFISALQGSFHRLLAYGGNHCTGIFIFFQPDCEFSGMWRFIGSFIKRRTAPLRL
jgi:hypothetical protein